MSDQMRVMTIDDVCKFNLIKKIPPENCGIYYNEKEYRIEKWVHGSKMSTIPVEVVTRIPKKYINQMLNDGVTL